MPIYEYKCKKCKAVFEYFAKTFNDVPTECPHCASKKIEKQMSAFCAAESKKKDSCACGGHHHEAGHHCCCGGHCHCGK